jgi:hypothetical protein
LIFSHRVADKFLGQTTNTNNNNNNNDNDDLQTEETIFALLQQMLAVQEKTLATQQNGLATQQQGLATQQETLAVLRDIQADQRELVNMSRPGLEGHWGKTTMALTAIGVFLALLSVVQGDWTKLCRAGRFVWGLARGVVSCLALVVMTISRKYRGLRAQERTSDLEMGVMEVDPPSAPSPAPAVPVPAAPAVAPPVRSGPNRDLVSGWCLDGERGGLAGRAARLEDVRRRYQRWNGDGSDERV